MRLKTRNLLASLTAIVLVTGIMALTWQKKKEITPQTEEWRLISDRTTATVYNAVPSQCNNDYLHTASMYVIEPERIPKQRILAMERTFMAEYGVRYGDVVRIEGTGRYDGLWQVQDTMNKRFKGQHKIDLLVPSHIRHGKWQGVKVYVPGNNLAREKAEKFAQEI